MALTAEDQERLDLEKKAVDEATKRYDDLISTLILIATSGRSKSEKFTLINEWKRKMSAFNNEFSSRQSELFYKKYSQQAFDEAKNLVPEIISKKKLSAPEVEELKNLSEQLRIGLNKRLGFLTEQAKQLVISEELTKIREQKIGLKNATDRTQITIKRAKPNLLFTNAKGQIVSMENVMRITIGDQLWATISSSQRSQWVRLGFRYVLHISVMDDKTTEICISLNKTKRDLLVDQLPPMHIRCRSKVKLLRDGWNKNVFLQNSSMES